MKADGKNDYRDESQLCDELSWKYQMLEIVRSDLVGPTRSISNTTAALCFVVSEATTRVWSSYHDGNLHRNGFSFSKHFAFNK